jgi:hypothetical protein
MVSIGSIDLENHPVKQILQTCLAETQSIHLNKKTGRFQNAGRGGRSNYYCSIADGVCGGAATAVSQIGFVGWAEFKREQAIGYCYFEPSCSAHSVVTYLLDADFLFFSRFSYKRCR